VSKVETETVSTELAIRVFETTPAVVSFNYQEISDHLDSVLEKYRGLIFTESAVAECKKTIAELRKGQKSLDEFRKTTKKQLTESVTFFETQCKTLYSKFDEVIRPLTQQQEQFELDRRENKRAEVQSIIDALVVEYKLSETYSSQLCILDKSYNKGEPLKAIKAELSALANTLRVQQDKKAQDIDLIRTKVELANALYQLANVLLPESYLRLLAFKSVTEIDSLINSDAQMVSSREKRVAETLIAEKVEVPKVVEVINPEPIKIPETILATCPPMATPAASKMITAVYEITGTDELLCALEAYLDASGLRWTDRSN
jgi:vacuolar-type H+-ATPase subunit I/STV1